MLRISSRTSTLSTKPLASSAGGQNLYSQFGASNAVLTKVTPEGTPSANAVWSQEASLDVEWAHAIAPAANIMLVEAKSDSIDDLVSAVNYASSHGAQVVSMSWGSQEFAGETAYDSTFQTAGVSYVASSGDTAVPEWPAVSPNVIGVGGTTLSVSAGGAYEGETTWNASGGGVSAFESKPSYQNGVTQSGTQRTSPDVAFDANPSTGFLVYDSYQGGGGWGVYGGTSAGAPQMAALLALANQQRQQQVPPLPTLSSAETLNAIYTLGTGPNSSSYFHSVASGSSGANSAATGYNLATGVGSPVANSLVAALGGSFANAPSAKTGSGATTTTTSPGGTTPRMGVLFVTIEFFLDANAFKPSAVQTGNNSIGYVAPPASMPFFMTQTLAAPPPRRFVYLVGERLDPSDDDGGDMTALHNLLPQACPALLRPR